MQRIYLPNTNFSENLCIFDSQIHHQITRVMRARVGQEYIFFDGITPKDYVYLIEDITKTDIKFALKEMREKDSELGVDLNLYQAIPNKLSKLEYIVQKCTEIGYKKIVFFESERSDTIVLSDKKMDRLQKIAIEATEQCGGNIVPRIHIQSDIMNTKEVFQGLRIICHTQNRDAQKLSEIVSFKKDPINIFVGPEGGFSDKEIDQFSQKKNLHSIYFGDRILRTETVGSVVGFYFSQK